MRLNSGEFTFATNEDGTLHAWRNDVGTDMHFGQTNFTDIMRGLDSWRSGRKVQDAFPFLDADRHEFIMTGMTPKIWNEMFPE